MRQDFLEKPIIIKDIPKEYPIDICLIENNEKQIGQACNFLQSDKNLLLVSGYRGSGKTQVVNFITDNLCNDVILLHYTCLETTNLDDMLLSFFDTFKRYTILGKITPPKNRVENFTQKINSYFNSIEKPILIVLDSFEGVIKENRADIINFIQHLIKFKNIKVIMISKTFQSDGFENIEHEKITILALSQKIFEKYLKSKGIKQIGVMSNELYKLSKGYYYNLVLTVNIMNLRQLSLVNFLEGYSKSYMAFSEFIIREALALIDPVSTHLFRLLTVMRIPIHINLLKSIHLYDEERLNFFISNSILTQDGNCIYLKDYFREIIENQIPDNVMIKLHGACIDLYNTQLPLKPLERDLMLSRQTMRNEIEYHSMFIPKKPQIPVQEIPVEPAITQQEEPELVKQDTPKEASTETKEDKINKISFIVDDEAILDNIAGSIKNFIDTTDKNRQLEKASVGMPLQQILNIAKQEEKKYHFKQVIILYQQALTKTNDEDFYTFLPSIYVKLAKAYQNLSQWYEALEYYTQAQDFYFNAGNTEKVWELKLEIANIYYIMYKHENARFILSELEKNPNLPNELAIKVNLACARLSNNSKTEYSYYKKSIPLVEINTDKSIVSELYYKYAVASDEQNDPRTSAEFYKKCIELDSNPKNNPYLSMSLSNLAELYDEAGATKLAIKYYNDSIEIDTATQNYNGLYYSAIHLGEIYSATDDEKACEYMLKALGYARILKEPFYIAGASLEIGDFYFLRKRFEQAYKYFMEAYNIAKTSFTKDNINKITARIQDLQKRINEQEFNKLQEKYGK
ncbi:AAA family ATPase [bacterium]|nr:AAA family ATPase [bacterium]